MDSRYSKDLIMFDGLREKARKMIMEGENNPPVVKKEEVVSFPKENKIMFEEPTTVKTVEVEITKSTMPTEISSSDLNMVKDIYEKIFESLNGPGIDLYEIFNAIRQSHPNFDIENKSVVEVIFNTFKTIDSNLTREKLITSANEYLEAIKKHSEEFRTQGESKLSALNTKKLEEKSSLINEISMAEKEIERQKLLIAEKKVLLNSIEDSYEPERAKIESTMKANQVVSEDYISKVTKLKTIL